MGILSGASRASFVVQIVENSKSCVELVKIAGEVAICANCACVRLCGGVDYRSRGFSLGQSCVAGRSVGPLKKASSEGNPGGQSSESVPAGSCRARRMKVTLRFPLALTDRIV